MKISIDYFQASDLISFIRKMEAAQIDMPMKEWVNLSKTKQNIADTFSIVEEKLQKESNAEIKEKMSKELIEVDIFPVSMNENQVFKGIQNITTAIHHGIITTNS
jgi:hypothetical protein